MSEKTERWLTVHIPVALSLIAIVASGSLAFGSTQTTAETNRGRIKSIEETIGAFENRLILRLDRQDARIDRVLEILADDHKDATSQRTDNP
jgi:hypothetical protein